ncbi:imidazolonepropionase [Fusobacterium necrophorum subsp. funduliforme]|uniref:Imidazolonepropionase n=1 Tax=Fusobacterium necrophorum subsp. funduliforme TaxID=143387 RepID=A0A161QUH0_9FUSO|nr:imidazolonepropionase [Fusobacterium necrophorum]EHO21557.1 imidazolonepropionase [Fusobacterium necrophorum subsp. funduliforme 1_1_36S]AVQ20837.1 imidazolonepropionase [Fusobacterium necrophorum subsp. funduliforme]AYV92518.1 imidazolonepropionase [Fusobacterium necrophorum subsp. funduliforme]KYL04462.1 imidazolonepropionase [Fusobacterium necrophorum subsp. funduliforme]KYM43484.1 imidazolonepropionase [Fusobacterium necrophorum subsp. funduliforme]
MKADLILYEIGQLITSRELEGNHIEILENGYLAIKGDKIIGVGTGEVPTSFIHFDTKFVKIGKKVVSPGLVDSHTHLVHGGSREHEFSMKIQGVPYLEILAAGGGILSTLKATREASLEELIEKTKKSLRYMLELGVTTVEAKSGYGLSLEQEIKQLEATKLLNHLQPISLVSTFMAAHATPPEFKGRTGEYVDEVIKMLPEIKKRNLAEFCDVFCEEGVFSVEDSRKILTKAKELGFQLKIHADEVVSLGGVELAGELQAVTAEHLMVITEEGIQALKKGKVIADLLPATSFNLRHEYAPARKILDAGVQVALSTDYNPGSCPSENLQFVMQIGAAHLKMTTEEVFKAVTINGAKAVCREKEIGSLEVGKQADIAVFDVPNAEYMLYHFGVNHTDSVYKAGKLVYQR